MIKIPESNRKDIISDLLPDLTPLLDIVFMLIVFLILTVNSTLYSLEVQLPKDKDDSSIAITDDKSIAIHLLAGRDGWKINETKYSSEVDFRQDLAKLAKKDDQIMIISDKNSPVEKLVSLLTFLEKKQISKVNIAVEK